MKNYLLFFALSILVSFSGFAQSQYHETQYFRTIPQDQNDLPKIRSTNSLTIDTIVTPTGIIDVLFGPGVSVANLVYTGDSLAIGKFSDITGTSGIDSGLVLTSGQLYGVPGPNNTMSMTGQNIMPGDSNLSIMASMTTYDAALIEFDFTPLTDTLMLSFIFGSEEYPEFVGFFNDVFAFWVWEQAATVPYNMAIVPGTSTPISINTINNDTNSAYYIDNTNGMVLQADAYTTPITQMYMTTPGQNYHFKIGIADAGDAAYDSYVFIKSKGLLGYAKMPSANFTYTISGNTVNFTNTGGWARKFHWDFGDGTTDTTANPVHTFPSKSEQYTVTLSAINYYQIDTMSVTIAVGGVPVPNIEKELTLSVVSSGNGLYCLNLNPLITANSLVSIFTMTGSQVYSEIIKPGQKEVILNLSSLPRGLYCLKLQGAEQSTSCKLAR